MRTALHLAVFLLFLGLWTWKLLQPSPVPEEVGRKIPSHLKVVAAKGLHVGAYAFLAVLGGTIPASPRGRWLVAGLLALHGVATEVAQCYVPNRTGSAADVLIDWAGIGVGFGAIRCWRSLSGRPVSSGFGRL